MSQSPQSPISPIVEPNPSSIHAILHLPRPPAPCILHPPLPGPSKPPRHPPTAQPATYSHWDACFERERLGMFLALGRALDSWRQFFNAMEVALPLLGANLRATVPKLEAEVTCSLCQGVLRDAHTISTCDHNFCRYAYILLLQVDLTCVWQACASRTTWARRAAAPCARRRRGCATCGGTLFCRTWPTCL